MMTRRVAVYAADVPGMSAEDQVQELRRYCRRRGWGEPVVYRDPPVRPAGETRLSARLRMLQAALRRQHDVVLVWRLAMLSPHNVNGLVTLLASLLANGIVRVVAVADGVDTGCGVRATRLVAALAWHEMRTNRRSGPVRPRDPCEGCPMARRRRGRRDGKGMRRP
jgi:DNA invertase Pin-like site-specific DNA recombinase